MMRDSREGMTEGSGPKGAGEPWRSVGVGSGREAVRLQLIRQGRDWVLVIGGGDAHVGAVSVRPAPGEFRGPDDALNVVIPPHKEGPLAVEAAARVTAATGRACAAIVGIHQDDATREEITAITENVREGLDSLLAKVPAGGNASHQGGDEE